LTNLSTKFLCSFDVFNTGSGVECERCNRGVGSIFGGFFCVILRRAPVESLNLLIKNEDGTGSDCNICYFVLRFCGYISIPDCFRDRTNMSLFCLSGYAVHKVTLVDRVALRDVEDLGWSVDRNASSGNYWSRCGCHCCSSSARSSCAYNPC